jgi:hypothetical protein
LVGEGYVCGKQSSDGFGFVEDFQLVDEQSVVLGEVSRKLVILWHGCFGDVKRHGLDERKFEFEKISNGLAVSLQLVGFG